MSGEGGPVACVTVGHRLLVVPAPDEAQAMADNLRDMLASGELNARLVRQTANSLEAMAIAARMSRCDSPGSAISAIDAWDDLQPQPDPLSSWALGTFEEDFPSREGSAP